jgi:hypothetical protein
MAILETSDHGGCSEIKTLETLPFVVPISCVWNNAQIAGKIETRLSGGESGQD